MTPWDVPGQEHAVTVLREAVARDEVAHAWAFIGPAGVGQEAATRWLAAALNCGAFEPPCGSCDICRRCLRGAHPALSEFLPVGAFHRVKDVREHWLLAASRSLAEGRTKVLRVADAHRMNESAANAFLKVLEEPPPRTVWVLEITDPDEIPDTILSRCRLVRFVAWRSDALEERARSLGLDDPEERGLAVRAAMGSPVQLARLAAPGGLDDLRAHRAWPALLREGGSGMAIVAARALDDEVKRRTAELKAQHKAELDEMADDAGGELPPALAKEIAERHTRIEREARVVVVQNALDDVAAWYRDCIVVLGGDEPLVHADVADSVGKDAEALGARRVLEAVDLVHAARESMEFNVQQGLAMEALFLQLATLHH